MSPRQTLADGRDREILARVARLATSTSDPDGVLRAVIDLIGEARRKEEAMAALIRETIAVQEDERRRVATEIHDGVTQQLVSIWFRVHACQRLLEQNDVTGALEEIQSTKAAIDETLAEARSAIYNLRPTTLDDLGLVAALHDLAARFRSDSEIEADVSAPEEIRLEPHVETALFRITQEALNNVRKHSAATRASVRLSLEAGTVTLEVQDDGEGFDVEQFTKVRPATSFGLSGMRERVELVGGRLHIDSEKGGGTKLRVEVPASDLEGAAE